MKIRLKSFTADQLNGKSVHFRICGNGGLPFPGHGTFYATPSEGTETLLQVSYLFSAPFTMQQFNVSQACADRIALSTTGETLFTMFCGPFD